MALIKGKKAIGSWPTQYANDLTAQQKSDIAYMFANKYAEILEYSILDEWTSEDSTHGNIYFIGDDYPRIMFGFQRTTQANNEAFFILPSNKYGRIANMANVDFRESGNYRNDYFYQYGLDFNNFRTSGWGTDKTIYVVYFKTEKSTLIFNPYYEYTTNYSNIFNGFNGNSDNKLTIFKCKALKNENLVDALFCLSYQKGAYNVTADMGDEITTNTSTSLFGLNKGLMNCILGPSSDNSIQYLLPIKNQGFELQDTYLYTNFNEYDIGSKISINNEEYVIVYNGGSNYSIISEV